MTIQSLIRENDRLVPAEVEVLLLPGLPQIHVLGLPDQVIKESLHRVRCALRTQGFEWPRARQILVNIRPVDRRKSSRGLELAIAAGMIWETKQKPPPFQQKGLYVYGELSLSGEVLEPEDLATDFRAQDGDLVLTGRGEQGRGFARQRVGCLADLDRPQREEPQGPQFEVERPQEGLQKLYSEAEARALSIAAVGEHHWLLAGSSGAGKTTLGNSLSTFLRAPNSEDLREGRLLGRWRPWVAPHHTTTDLAMIGGGVPPRRGEISRADGGVLFLDELLEFSTSVQEALREPIESGKIQISRGSRSETFPARWQLVATTNLCPCGRWAPGVSVSCGHSMRKCRSVLARISGPFFDRFEMMTFALKTPQKRRIRGEQILERVEAARTFQASVGGGTIPELWGRLEEPWREELRSSPLFQSERRRNATLRVAASLAALEISPLIRGNHVHEALELTLKNFEKLRQGEMGV